MSSNESNPAWLLEILSRDRGQWQEFAAGAIQNMAQNNDHRISPVREYQATPVLLDVARQDAGKVREFTCGALWGLVNCAEIREEMLQQGLLDLVCFVMKEDNTRACDNVCGCLSTMVADEDFAKKILSGDLGDVLKVVLDVLWVSLRGEGEGQMLVVPETKIESLVGVLWTLASVKSCRVSVCNYEKFLATVSRLIAFAVRQQTMFGKIGERFCEICCSLINLLTQVEDNVTTIVADLELIAQLSSVVRGFQSKAAQVAALALQTCARNIREDSVNVLLDSCEERLLRDETQNKDKEELKVVEAIVGVLFGLSFVDNYRDLMMSKTQVIHHILDLAKSRDGRTQESAVGCLWGLTSRESCRPVLLQEFSTLETVAFVLNSSKARDRTKENACWVLQNFTCDDVGKQAVIETDRIMEGMDLICRAPYSPELRTQEIVCGVLHQLATNSVVKLKMISDYDVVGTLHAVMKGQANIKTKTKACSALWLMSVAKESKTEMLNESGLLDTICRLVASDKAKIRKVLCLTLLQLSEVKANKTLIGEHSFAMEALAIVMAGDDVKSTEIACGVLSSLAFHENVRNRLVDANGVVDALTKAASDSTQVQTRFYAVSSLWGISFCEDARARLVTQFKVHSPVLALLKEDISGKILEYGCGTLQNLSIERSNRPYLVKESEVLDVLTQVIIRRERGTRSVMESATGTLQNLSIDETVREEMASPTHKLVLTLLELVIENSKLATVKSEFDDTASTSTLDVSSEFEIALATLKNLSITAANKTLFVGEYGMVAPLTEVVRVTQGKPRKLAYQLLRNLPLSDKQVAELCGMFKTLPDSPEEALNSARTKTSSHRFSFRFSMRKSQGAAMTGIDEDPVAPNPSFFKRMSHRFSSAHKLQPESSTAHTLAPRMQSSPTLPFEDSRYLSSPSVRGSARNIFISPSQFITPRTPPRTPV
eukprot:c6888_g1_i1.p1 GENE.c6888_g1_i1~~c6888_g1_i1.p1  ORF type:complete len:944 (-),score=215.05 c6888_g1_i1:289-3120(-)